MRCYMSEVLEASGKYLGGIWVISEKHPGGIWESSGRHLGGSWATAAPGRLLRLPGISGSKSR